MPSKAVVGNWKLNGSLAAQRGAPEGAPRGRFPGSTGAACAVCVPVPVSGPGRGAAEGLGDRLGRPGREPLRQGRVHGRSVGGDGGGVRRPLRDRRALGAPDGLRRHGRDRGRRSTPRRSKAGLTPIFCVGETLEEREAAAPRRCSRGRSTRCWRSAASRSWTAASSPTSRCGPSARAGRRPRPRRRKRTRSSAGASPRRMKDVAARLPILYGGSVKGSERGGIVRDAGRRWRLDRRGVAGGGRIRGDLAGSRRAGEIRVQRKCIRWS